MPRYELIVYVQFEAIKTGLAGSTDVYVTVRSERIRHDL